MKIIFWYTEGDLEEKDFEYYESSKKHITGIPIVNDYGMIKQDMLKEFENNQDLFEVETDVFHSIYGCDGDCWIREEWVTKLKFERISKNEVSESILNYFASGKQQFEDDLDPSGWLTIYDYDIFGEPLVEFQYTHKILSTSKDIVEIDWDEI